MPLARAAAVMLRTGARSVRLSHHTASPASSRLAPAVRPSAHADQRAVSCEARSAAYIARSFIPRMTAAFPSAPRRAAGRSAPGVWSNTASPCRATSSTAAVSSSAASRSPVTVMFPRSTRHASRASAIRFRNVSRSGGSARSARSASVRWADRSAIAARLT